MIVFAGGKGTLYRAEKACLRAERLDKNLSSTHTSSEGTAQGNQWDVTRSVFPPRWSPALPFSQLPNMTGEAGQVPTQASRMRRGGCDRNL